MYYTVKLNNGIKVIAEEVKNIRSISLGIWVKSGSRYESPWCQGISHFIEHMLFKGTKNRTTKEIANEIDDIAAEVNAFTSREYTCLYLKVIDEYFEKGLDIVSDIILNPLFPPEEIERERQVILEEIKMYKDTPEEVVHDLMIETCFEGSSLAYNVLGQEKVIDKLDKSILMDYFNEKFNANNIVISVAGNIEPEKVCSLIERYFEGINKYDGLEVNIDDYAAEYQQNDSYNYKDIEQAHYCMAFPGISYSDEKIYQLSLLNNILGGSMSSRLFQNIREAKGLAYSVFSYPVAFCDCGLFMIYAGISPENVEKAGELILENLMELVNNNEGQKIMSQELERARAQIKGSLIFSLESTNSRMLRLGYSQLLKGQALTPEQVIERIDNITLADLEKLSSKLFLTQELSTALVGPVNKIFNPVKK